MPLSSAFGLSSEVQAGQLERSMTGPELADMLELHPRSVADFPDAVVALRLLHRDGDGPRASYKTTADTELFLEWVRSPKQICAGGTTMAT